MKLEGQKLFSETFLRITYHLLPIFLILLVLCSSLYAGIIDRVVAFVDDTAITLSELYEVYSESIKLNPEISKKEVLDSMINRVLLLREAKKLRLNAPSDEELLREYISLRIVPHIREEDILNFYQRHIDDFRGKDFESVRGEIENYLTESELNRLLKKHIEELRKKA